MLESYEPPQTGVPIVAVRKRRVGDKHDVRCVESTGKPVLEDVVRMAATAAGVDLTNMSRQYKKGIAALVESSAIILSGASNGSLTQDIAS